MPKSDSPDIVPDTEVQNASTDSAPTRRNMLVEFVTAVLSFLLVAVPSTIGGLFFLDPVIRGQKGKGEDGSAGELDGFVKLPVSAENVPADGTPVAVTVKDDLVDAWNRFRDVPIGSVWLRKNPDGQILVFNSVCPHLGCSVNFRRSEGDFFCPCHTSSFGLDGAKTNEVPPRDMDTLELQRTTAGAVAADGDELWVRYQNFRRATAEKIPI